MNYDDNEKMFISSSYDSSNNPWTIDYYRTGMIGEIDFDKKKFSYESCLCISDNTVQDYYDDVIIKGNRLFLLPFKFLKEPAITVIELHEMKKQEVFLKNMEIPSSLIDEIRFAGMISIGEYIFFIPYSYPAIVRIDTRDFSVKYIDKWFSDSIKIYDEDCKKGYFVSKQYVIKNGYLYVPFMAISALLKLDITSLKEEIIYVGTKSQGFSCICDWDKDNILISGAGDNKDWLFLWDEKTKKIVKEWKMQETPNDLSVFKMLVSRDGDIYIFPWQNWGLLDVDIYCLKRHTMELKKMNLLPDYRSKNDSQVFWGDEIINAHWKDEDTLLYVTGRDFKWHEFNVVTNEYKEYDVLFDKDNDDVVNKMKEYVQVKADFKQSLKEVPFGFKAFVESIE